MLVHFPKTFHELILLIIFIIVATFRKVNIESSSLFGRGGLKFYALKGEQSAERLAV
jgi:hypothetical protein